MDRLQKVFAEIGAQARAFNIRLSFHPSQFVVIGSLHPHIRDNSVRELEYHALVAHMMGYRDWHVDGFAINVHVGGKQAVPKTVRKEFKRMSATLRNNITLENDEFSWHLRPILDEFEEHVPIVLDVHHYWISRGRRLNPKDDLVDRLIKSWRGVRPKLHLAITEQALVPEEYWTTPIPLQPLIDLNIPKGKLRIHSMSPWHWPSVKYAGKFKDFDAVWEGKDKNLGQMRIAKGLKLI
jgi:UV DNA damage repair endonuclease